MGDRSESDLARGIRGSARSVGSPPWMTVRERQTGRSRVFKSGNSLAVRIPAGTRLEAGMEMDMVIEDGVHLSFDPVEGPKRKFNVAKVAGSAPALQFIADEDRAFHDRSLLDPTSPPAP